MVAQLLTVNQVAEMLSIDRSTVYRLVSEGALDKTNVGTARGSGRGAMRIPQVSVDAFLKVRTGNAKDLNKAGKRAAS